MPGANHRGQGTANTVCVSAVVVLDQRKSLPRYTWNCNHGIDAQGSHDDITYQSIAKAFGLQVKLYQEAYDRMRKLSKPRPGEGAFDWDVESPAKTAKLRMVELPTEDSVPLEKQFIFPREDLWVPVAVVNGNIHILPGVPRLCKLSHNRPRSLCN